MRRRRPVVVRARRVQFEAHLARLAGGDLDAVGGTDEGAIVKTVHDERRVGEGVPDRDDHSRAGAHANHRSRDAGALAGLGERLNERPLPVIAVGAPFADARLEAERQVASALETGR